MVDKVQAKFWVTREKLAEIDEFAKSMGLTRTALIFVSLATYKLYMKGELYGFSNNDAKILQKLEKLESDLRSVDEEEFDLTNEINEELQKTETMELSPILEKSIYDNLKMFKKIDTPSFAQILGIDEGIIFNILNSMPDTKLNNDFEWVLKK